MSGKSSHWGGIPNKGKKSGKPEEKREDVLQAVLLADDFQDRFRPFSLQTPRCLLPLGGAPLIDYTLEFLALSGVQEVFLYCGAYVEKIEDYILGSPRWNSTSPICPFSSLEFIRVADANSVGDLLRDLDKRGLVGGDFILVHGDVVANVPLDAALTKHRARREANRDACMTMVLRRGGEEPHRAKPIVCTPVFVIDPSNGRCLQYDETHAFQRNGYLELDLTVLEQASDIEVRSDLIDCGIDICTPDVLALWSENFDHEMERKHFLHGVLKDWELNGKLVYVEEVDTGYAVRANTLTAYAGLSRDYRDGYIFPFLPSSNLARGQQFTVAARNSHHEDRVSMASSCRVESSILGSRTVVGERSTIRKSIIGRRCKIGKNVKIEDTSIWDDTVIEDDATVTGSILADSVYVGKASSVPIGSLISSGVSIDTNIHLPRKPRPILSILNSDGEPIDPDTSLVGRHGKGAYFRHGDDNEADTDDEADRDPHTLKKSRVYSLDGLELSLSSTSTMDSSDSDDEGEADSQAMSLQRDDTSPARDRRSSFASDDESTSASLTPGSFHDDAVHGLMDALADGGTDFDSAKLEFMGLRLGQNASDLMVRRAVAVAFAQRAADLMSPEHGSLEPTKATAMALSSRGAIKFVKEVGVGDDEAQQVEFVLALQKALLACKCLDTVGAGRLLVALLKQLYSLDVVEEDGILSWWADDRSSDGERMTSARDKCKILVTWLEEAEEEDEDEDEDVEDDGG